MAGQCGLFSFSNKALFHVVKFTARAIEKKKPQIPNPKHQITNKFKIPMIQTCFFENLNFDIV
jgi:hypothetical protein